MGVNGRRKNEGWGEYTGGLRHNEERERENRSHECVMHWHIVKADNDVGWRMKKRIQDQP